jgi:hypothetical protein
MTNRHRPLGLTALSLFFLFIVAAMIAYLVSKRRWFAA